jgi:competence protein ComEC
VIGIAFLFIAASLSARADVLAQRTGSASCWVLLQSDARSLCVPKPLWLDWLRATDPSPWQGEIPGKWKAGAAFKNPPLEWSDEKPTRELLVASSLPESPPHSVFERVATQVQQLIERWRERVSEQLAAADSLHLFRSILLGERGRNDPGGVLRIIGFVHLLSASGIHLYALARALSSLILFLSEVFLIPAPIALWSARVASGIAWIAAWTLAGMPWGMFRPWVIVSARSSARYFGFRWRKAFPLLFALLLDGILSAGHGGGSGRIFYALAVGGALIGEEQGVWGLAWCCWIFAALWEIARFQRVAFLTPVISVLSLALLGGVVYPSVFFLSLLNFSVAPFLQISDFIVLFLARIALRFDTLWMIPRNALALAAIMSVAALVVPIRFRRRVRALFLGGAALCALFPLFNHPHDVIQLDVGQGDSALVLADQTGLIDSGSEHSLSDAAWIELLAASGVTRLDFSALTHLDEDHSGGLKRLARLLPIQCATTSLGELQSPRGKLYRETLASSGVEIRDWGEPCVPFPTYAPPVSTGANQNMGAVLIPLDQPRFNYLSAGDADRPEERTIAAWARPLLALHPADLVLKVSHHGSKTSSDPLFFKELAPTLALISVGRGNSYGLPSVETLLRLESFDIPFFRTAKSESRQLRRQARPRVRAGSPRHAWRKTPRAPIRSGDRRRAAESEPDPGKRSSR